MEVAKDGLFQGSVLKNSILFAMRYGDDVGFVWNTIARVRDLAASHLCDEFDCYIAYPYLSGRPAQSLEHLRRLELNCYDMSEPALARLNEAVRKHNVQVLVYMSALPSSLKLPRLRAMGLRTINTENDSFDHRRRDPPLKELIKVVTRRWFHRQVHDLHIANARSQAQYLLDHYKLPRARLRTVVNGIDCDHFRPLPQGRAVMSVTPDEVLPPDRLWILCVGQARPEKRIEWAIRAAQRLRREFPELSFGFAYVGDGPSLQGWRDQVAQLGLGSDFRFLGAQQNTAPFYQHAELMVHAAERESFGLAVVEAMACGLPVVATSAAGPSETVVHGETGILVGLADEEAFYQAIVDYVLDPELRKRHGALARVRAVEHYSIARQARQYADVIRSCAAARRPVSRSAAESAQRASPSDREAPALQRLDEV